MRFFYTILVPPQERRLVPLCMAIRRTERTVLKLTGARFLGNWLLANRTNVLLQTLAHAVPGAPHEFKYRRYFGRNGQTLVRYDNERGKGGHRHVGVGELPYQFKTLEGLIEDFFADVEGST